MEATHVFGGEPEQELEFPGEEASGSPLRGEACCAGLSCSQFRRFLLGALLRPLESALDIVPAPSPTASNSAANCKGQISSPVLSL